MTTDLEKQFFDAFGIEPDVESCYGRCYHKCDTKSYLNCKDCDKATVIYPQITSDILLELICILNNYGKYDTWAVSVEKLKDFILMNCIKVIKEKDLNEMPLNNFKSQIQALFKE